MGSYTNAWAAKLNDLMWGGTAFVVPGTVYFGLSTTAIGEAGTGATEPVGNAYARVAVPNTPVSFPAGATKLLAADVLFPVPTGAGWGNVVDWFIADSLNGGSIIVFGSFPAPITVVSGSAPKWPANSITLTQD